MSASLFSPWNYNRYVRSFNFTSHVSRFFRMWMWTWSIAYQCVAFCHIITNLNELYISQLKCKFCPMPDDHRAGEHLRFSKRAAICPNALRTSYCYWLTVSLWSWLIESLTHWLTHWLTYWLSDLYWLTGRLTDSLTQWLADWLTDCLMTFTPRWHMRLRLPHAIHMPSYWFSPYVQYTRTDYKSV